MLTPKKNLSFSELNSTKSVEYRENYFSCFENKN